MLSKKAVPIIKILVSKEFNLAKKKRKNRTRTSSKYYLKILETISINKKIYLKTMPLIKLSNFLFYKYLCKKTKEVIFIYGQVI